MGNRAGSTPALGTQRNVKVFNTSKLKKPAIKAGFFVDFQAVKLFDVFHYL